MGASNSTRPRRASSDVTQGRRRAQLRSASGTFLRTENHLLAPWYPSTPITSRSNSPRTPRSSFLKVPDGGDSGDSTVEGARGHRANSRSSFLGKLIRRKRASSSSTLEGTELEGGVGNLLVHVPCPVASAKSGQQISAKKAMESRSSDHDSSFLQVSSRPRLASAESSCTEEEDEEEEDEEERSSPPTRSSKKQRSETLVYRAAMVEKAVQTERSDGSVTCDHCRRRCLCYADPYDSNSSTQSLRLQADAKSQRRRKRWSPLIGKRQTLLKQAVQPGLSAAAVGTQAHERAVYQSQMRPSQLPPSQDTPISPHTRSGSGKRWHIPYHQKRRPQRTFSEDRSEDMDYPVGSGSFNARSDPSLCPLKVADVQPPADHHGRRGRLYALCLQRGKAPLAKTVSCSPTVPLRRQTWSEKCRPQRPHGEGQTRARRLLHLLRNPRSTCSETDISMEHRPSVDSNGYVDPFYITRNFSRMHLKRLSLSHPNLGSGLRGSTTPPLGLKGVVSAAMGRLERALTGRGSIGRTYSMESQQSTSTGWNSDLTASPTDSETAAASAQLSYGRPDAEDNYMTFDPEMNPPVVRPRLLLSSSCSSAPSSPGFQEVAGGAFSDALPTAGWEKEGIYETLDNYSPKCRSNTLKSLPSSEGEAPPEVPPRPPSHRLRYKKRMLRRQMPLPPIPITMSAGSIEDGAVEIATAPPAGNINNSALQSLYMTTRRRSNVLCRQSTSCSTLPFFQMDSSEEDSVFEAQVQRASAGQLPKGASIGSAWGCPPTRYADEKLDSKCNHKPGPDMSINKPLHMR